MRFSPIINLNTICKFYLISIIIYSKFFPSIQISSYAILTGKRAGNYFFADQFNTLNLKPNILVG
ncbi:MAG: hypothetical protein CM15mP73_3290 [Hyphomicrobiales bacterium]|nr:MAG: hypothetical protein CM15mP73_3290 [Hyphomicrobiales bacterium]